MRENSKETAKAHFTIPQSLCLQTSAVKILPSSKNSTSNNNQKETKPTHTHTHTTCPKIPTLRGEKITQKKKNQFPPASAFFLMWALNHLSPQNPSLSIRRYEHRIHLFAAFGFRIKPFLFSVFFGSEISDSFLGNQTLKQKLIPRSGGGGTTLIF